MRVLVTGATGFIGGHLVRALAEAGDEVVAMVRKPSAALACEQRIATLSDEAALTAACAGVDLVVHLAGMTAGNGAQDFMEINGGGTARLLAAAQRAAVRRVVYVSSLAACGPSRSDRPLREADPPRPVSLYGRSKHAGERAAWEAAQRGQQVLILRPPIVYGPGDEEFGQLIRFARWGIAFRLGLRVRWFSAVHVADVVQGILQARTGGRPLPRGGPHALDGGEGSGGEGSEAGAGIYFLTDGERYSFDAFGRTAARLLGRPALTLPLPVPAVWCLALLAEGLGALRGRLPILNRDKVREGAAHGWWASTDKARQELGYGPRWPLERGLADTMGLPPSAPPLA